MLERTPAHAPPRLTAYLVAVHASALVALGSVTAALAPLAPRDASSWALALALLAATYFLLRLDVPFTAGGQRHVITLEEGVVLLALLAVGPVPTVLVVAGAAALAQLRAQRPLRKAAYNVAAYTLAAALASGAFAALVLAVGFAEVASAVVAVAVYVLANIAVAAGLYARLEGRAAAAVLVQRFAAPALMQLGIGACMGVLLFVLWLESPLLLLLGVPFGPLLSRHVRLVSATDHATELYRRLARVAGDLARDERPERAADVLLIACGDVLPSGRASLTLRTADGERTWTREFEGGAAPDARPIEAPLRAPDGRVLGILRVEAARRYRLPLGAADAELLHLLAGEASAILGRSVP